ncbi:MAG: ABC transporter ATP-binding protein [Coriobacteriaceae bacterium]|nr:ABC transporter ATP-binding protein [Coriobacteriaceae bacterium]
MLEILKRFWRPYRANLIVGPACKLIEVLFDLLTPLVVARMIDEGIRSRDMDTVLRYGLVLLAMAVAGILFALVCQKMASRASQGIGTDVRRDLYARINEFSYAELDRFGTPSLVTRITNDVNQIQLAVALAIRQLIRWPFLAVGSMAAALLIDPLLGTVFIVTAPVIGGVFWWVMARTIPLYRRIQAMLDRVGLITREGLSGVRVIRAFVREEHERTRFREAADGQMRLSVAVGRLNALLNPATFLIMNLGICVILWQGGLAVGIGRLTQGEIVAIVNYMTQTLLSIVYVANLVIVFTRASASSSRVLEVLDCEPSIVSPERARVPAHTADAPAIRLDRASFAFGEAAAPAVDGISLELPAGATLGVIGGTGSGKSTLISLLPRLYDTTSGTVEILGADVRSWPLDELRRTIGLVPQAASLVSGTIRSNLLWRDPAAADDELWRALDTAQAGEFVRKLPEGLDAPVEAGGRNFSGGQRQRLTIARALVGATRILILDDAASALDLRTDAALREAVRRRAEASDTPLTTVIVSQRVSSVRTADQILVMRRGRAVGLGTHDGLLASCAVYREICASQGVAVPPAATGEEVSA